jgi:hypothetical protein
MPTWSFGRFLLQACCDTATEKLIESSLILITNHGGAVSSSSSGSEGNDSGSSAAVSTGLGLHGMSQKQFEKIVRNRVTSEVARVLLRTMRPLKRVLKEQQQKIAELEEEHGERQMAEKRCVRACVCMYVLWAGSEECHA